ncbi:DUF4188 domain-containing protein [Microbacterium oxydans]|uniref:DUF4188 domain-containing protein n=1 Tax=Microbacterium oxydans TaxID=82380 RepID=UPI001E4E6364|nr:DUF4188 domain-containing protein [Microbacterium oxydans]
MTRNAPGAVGIWHETFLVDQVESVYVSTKTDWSAEGDIDSAGRKAARPGAGAVRGSVNCGVEEPRCVTGSARISATGRQNGTSENLISETLIVVI